MSKLCIIGLLLLTVINAQQFTLSPGNLDRQRRYDINRLDIIKENNPDKKGSIAQIWIFLLCYFLVVICIIVAVTIFVLKKNLERNNNISNYSKANSELTP